MLIYRRKFRGMGRIFKMDIYYMDRKSGEKLKESVAGEGLLKWTYEHPIGMGALELLVKKKFFSQLYGLFLDHYFSKRKIKDFVKSFSIDMTEAIREDIKEYESFNDFFTRKLKNSARPIITDKEILICPADGRVLAYENIDINRMVQVKGFNYTLSSLLNDVSLAKEYHGGTCVVVRLSPVDYHRFHFPDKGVPIEHKYIKGHYYSVNPMALQKVAEIYCQNKREITIFNSQNFNKILLVEVGATCVGSIIQTHELGKNVDKGEEKGYFKFGGSTVMMILKSDEVVIDKDILKNTEAGIETKVNMGEGIGCKPLTDN